MYAGVLLQENLG
uniref:Uncharacterized protein n=1 Tax=Anguilla anguilla TaxID=7936 RepID=A0A0E9TR03_ANGAN